MRYPKVLSLPVVEASWQGAMGARCAGALWLRRRTADSEGDTRSRRENHATKCRTRIAAQPTHAYTMILRQSSMFLLITLGWLCGLASPHPDAVDTVSLKHIANISYAAEKDDLSSLASIFSPRMDFDQWKPLTGRGDPLRNDPTYDYEPPVLERVHYWADDIRLEREHYPERKSEVLMLGVSSRRPSVAPHQPPPRRHQRPPVPPKYEDYTYKINEHYPMTILVPPPPPPPGHKPPLYVLTENKVPLTNFPVKITNPPTFLTKKPTTPIPKNPSSSYALQESNLIYQSSTTSHNWLLNRTKSIPNIISSDDDYTGWGPTVPIDETELANDTQNLIPTDQNEIFNHHPYTFYKPMLSEAPPPPSNTTSSLFLPTFVPNALPPTEIPQTSTFSITRATSTTDLTTPEVTTNSVQDDNEETTTERQTHQKLTPVATFLTIKPDKNIFNMLGPMLSMPLINGPERPEDNLYAHASENLQVYKEHPTEDTVNLETMQTMQPPPPVQITESTTLSNSFQSNPHAISSLINNKEASTFTHDPYLHMRFTTIKPNKIETQEDSSEEPPIPMYLIIQGHSKVKTYSSKPNLKDDRNTISNEIPKPKETNEVKHLHPLQGKKFEKTNKSKLRESRSKNLKNLVENNFGSIEIQEADVGIKYDVSDGSEVPVEIYRKGIVDSDENSYTLKTQVKQKRTKRQIDLEDLLPFDEDTIEEYVYNFLNGKRNSTGITGLIAQAVTSDAAAVVDDLEEEGDDEENEQEEEER